MREACHGERDTVAWPSTASQMAPLRGLLKEDFTLLVLVALPGEPEGASNYDDRHTFFGGAPEHRTG